MSSPRDALSAGRLCAPVPGVLYSRCHGDVQRIPVTPGCLRRACHCGGEHKHFLVLGSTERFNCGLCILAAPSKERYIPGPGISEVSPLAPGGDVKAP